MKLFFPLFFFFTFLYYYYIYGFMLDVHVSVHTNETDLGGYKVWTLSHVFEWDLFRRHLNFEDLCGKMGLCG